MLSRLLSEAGNVELEREQARQFNASLRKEIAEFKVPHVMDYVEVKVSFAHNLQQRLQGQTAGTIVAAQELGTKGGDCCYADQSCQEHLGGYGEVAHCRYLRARGLVVVLHLVSMMYQWFGPMVNISVSAHMSPTNPRG